MNQIVRHDLGADLIHAHENSNFRGVMYTNFIVYHVPVIVKTILKDHVGLLDVVVANFLNGKQPTGQLYHTFHVVITMCITEMGCVCSEHWLFIN